MIASISMRVLLSAMLFCALVLPAAAQSEAEAGPRAVAERVDDALLSVMREAKTLGYRGRYDRLAPVLDQSFDFPFMARVSVGRHWRELEREQKAELTQAFAELSVATFAARFDGYGGETFEITGLEEQPRGLMLVLNRLVKADGEAVSINFLMAERQGDWRVIDVFLDDKFSELAVKRSEYTAVIERKGFPELIETLKQKAAGLAKEP